MMAGAPRPLPSFPGVSRPWEAAEPFAAGRWYRGSLQALKLQEVTASLLSVTLSIYCVSILYSQIFPSHVDAKLSPPRRPQEEEMLKEVFWLLGWEMETRWGQRDSASFLQVGRKDGTAWPLQRARNAAGLGCLRRNWLSFHTKASGWDGG